MPSALKGTKVKAKICFWNLSTFPTCSGEQNTEPLPESLCLAQATGFATMTCDQRPLC